MNFVLSVAGFVFVVLSCYLITSIATGLLLKKPRELYMRDFYFYHARI